MNKITKEMMVNDNLHKELEDLGIIRVPSSYDVPDILWSNNMDTLRFSYYWGDPKDKNCSEVKVISRNPIVFELKGKKYTPDEIKEYAKSPEGKKELHPISLLKRKINWEIWNFFYENHNLDLEPLEEFKKIKINIEKEIDKITKF